MQNLRYYIRRELIGQIPNEKVEERYAPVNFEVKYQCTHMQVDGHQRLDADRQHPSPAVYLLESSLAARRPQLYHFS